MLICYTIYQWQPNGASTAISAFLQAIIVKICEAVDINATVPKSNRSFKDGDCQIKGKGNDAIIKPKNAVKSARSNGSISSVSLRVTRRCTPKNNPAVKGNIEYHVKVSRPGRMMSNTPKKPNETATQLL